MSSNQEKTSVKPSCSYFWISDLRRDFEFSLRALIKRPMLAAIPMLSTAVGIGACSLIFAVANFALCRPLPVASGSTLMSITGGNAKTGEAGNAISYPDFLDIGKSQSFLNTAAYFPMMPAALSFNGGEPRRYWGTIASASYFDVVISHRLWISLFGADPGILNRTIVLNNHRVTVIGVAPSRFLGTEVGLVSDFWIPSRSAISSRRSFPYLTTSQIEMPNGSSA